MDDLGGYPHFRKPQYRGKLEKKNKRGGWDWTVEPDYFGVLSGCNMEDEDEDEDEDDDNDESLVKGFLLMSVPSFKLNTETQSLRTCRINSLKSEAGTEPENGPMSQTVNQ